MKYDAFLSHNRNDALQVERVAEMLEQRAGIKTFLDRWHLKPGDPWQEELEAALQCSATCVVFIGPSGIGPWQNEEMRAAIEQRLSTPTKRVVPVLLPGTNDASLDSLPAFLRRLTFADLRYGLTDSKAFNSLVSGIRGEKAMASIKASDVGSTHTVQIVLTARIEKMNLPLIEAMTQHLRKLTGDAQLTIVDISTGSVILTLRVAQSALDALKKLKTEQNANLLGFPIQTIRFELASQKSVTPDSFNGDHLFPEFREIISRTCSLDADDIHPSSTLAKLQVDSLTAVELLFHVEDHYGISVPVREDEYYYNMTIARLCGVLDLELRKAFGDAKV